MGDNKIKKLTLLNGTKFLSLYDAEYTNRVGNINHWIIASRKNYETLKEQYFNGKEEKIDAVIIAALHKESSKLVLVKQYRVPLNDYVYELPAGLVDGNESMETSVKRELKEETGLELIEINYEKSKRKVYASTGMTDEAVAMVYCTCEGEVSKEYLEDDEDIEVYMVSQNEAKSIIKHNIKMDVKAFMLLQSFAEIGEDIFN